MSDSIKPTPLQPVAASGNVQLIGAIIVSCITMGAFLAALAAAYFSKDGQNLTLLIGAVIANATSAVGFWLGSSAGSQRKTELDAQRTTTTGAPTA